jgi:uncharacterized protein YdhG (YjbR/CyaY superfamily)
LNKSYADVDAYLADVPPQVREGLQTLRRTIKSTVPDAVETISYGLPTFKYRGRPLTYFGAAKKHSALYALPFDLFPEETAGYNLAKGTLRFPHSEPPPAALVEKLLRARVEAIDAAEAERRPKKARA